MSDAEGTSARGAGSNGTQPDLSKCTSAQTWASLPVTVFAPESGL